MNQAERENQPEIPVNKPEESFVEQQTRICERKTTEILEDRLERYDDFPEEAQARNEFRSSFSTLVEKSKNDPEVFLADLELKGIAVVKDSKFLEAQIPLSSRLGKIVGESDGGSHANALFATDTIIQSQLQVMGDETPAPVKEELEGVATAKGVIFLSRKPYVKSIYHEGAHAVQMLTGLPMSAVDEEVRLRREMEVSQMMLHAKRKGGLEGVSVGKFKTIKGPFGPALNLEAGDIYEEVSYYEANKMRYDALIRGRREERDVVELQRLRVELGSETIEDVVRQQANFEGDWTELLLQRLTNPDIKKKMFDVKEKHLDSYRDGEPGRLDKPEYFKKTQLARLQAYEALIDRTFAQTSFGFSSEFSKPPTALGVARREEDGFRKDHIFLDAAHSDGTPLSARQKNMIEAHEKGHVIREFLGTDAVELKLGLDEVVLNSEEVKKPGYIQTADEIAERMAQLKNYFGFKGNEFFTKAHLDYARTHYLDDTKLDNSMRAFLSCVTNRTEEKFLKNMNEYPL